MRQEIDMPDTKLKKLETLLSLETLRKLADKALTKNEFVKYFEMVLKAVKDLKHSNSQEWSLIHSAVSMLGEKLKQDVAAEVSDKKGEVMTYCMNEMEKMMTDLKQMEKEQMDGMKFVYDKVASIKNGKDADETKIIAEVLSKIPRDTAEQERDRLESLKGNERLDKSAIRGLDEELKKVSRVQFGGTGARQRVFVKDATSQCDGSNKTFTTGGTHYGIIGVFSTQFPLVYRPTIDYTITATGVILTDAVSAPAKDQTLILQFIK